VRLALWAAALTLVLSGCTTQFLTGELSGSTPAPDFQLTDIDGQHWNLTDLQGQVVMLDFMGTWCGPCQRGVPMLRDITQAYPDLVFLSISSTDTRGQLDAFRTQFSADWPFVADDGSTVQAYLEAGAGRGTMIWPSYAIIDTDGNLRFYNQAETLPSTFTAALDDMTVRTGPAISAGAVGLAGVAGLLGFLAWSSPYLLKHTVAREARRPAASPLVGLLLYGMIAIAGAFYSRPLSGRVAALAPFLIVASALAIIYWRFKGTEHIQAHGKGLDSERPWRHTAAFWGTTLWYALPVWGAVLHAAMLRTSSQETLLLPIALGVGIAAAEFLGRQKSWQLRLQSLHDRAGWLGGFALIVAAVWNAMLYLR
jgi:peroxiredoxin